MATGQAPRNPIPAMRTYPPVEHPVVVVGPQYLAQYPVELAVNDFKVSDIKGTLIFKVKFKLSSINRLFLKDAAGNTLVNLRKKTMTMHGRWEAFRGESKEENDLLFTAKESKTGVDVFLGNNKGEVPDFKVHGRDTLAIMPNVDYAFIVALLVVILKGINPDDHREGAALKGINGVIA
ncbi:hypothetical protein Peur_034104 [Populus x canadensis]